MGKMGIITLIIDSLLLSFFGSIYLYYEVCLGKCICLVKIYKWVDLFLFSVGINLYFDVLVCVMLIMVSFISLIVHMYSMEYMYNDQSFNRFFSYLAIFTFFMFLLVSADNLIQLFFGWEGVGLASYLLINFWYTRLMANKAAIKAMLVNRIGDLALLMAISLCVLKFASVKYAVIFSLCGYFSNFFILFLGIKIKLLHLICLFLFLGAMGKSAQLGLHMWLPDAMEGPTPVSALIHAATMLQLVYF